MDHRLPDIQIYPPFAPDADHPVIRQMLADYLRMYAGRDDRLTGHFSEDFSGFTGGGNFLVKDRAEWVAITRQDFAQVKEPIRIELKDVSVQSLTDTIAVATSFFTIHLPIKDHILSRETARLVLIFRLEATGWKISHSSISIPYHLVREGEVYPLKELEERNQSLERVVAERTNQLSAANVNLHRANEDLARKITEHRQAEEALQRSEETYRSILNASPDDITITDLQCRILMLSPAAVTMFGFARAEDGYGRLFTDFIIPEDRVRATAHIALQIQGGAGGPGEYHGLRRDGSTFAFEANSEFIRDAAGVPTGMVFIVRDITERKQAEAEREKLELQNQQLQKSESLGRMAGAIAHHLNNQLHAVMMSLEQALGPLPPAARETGSLAIAMQSARKAAEVSGLMLTYLGKSPATPERLDFSATCRLSLPLLHAVRPRNVAVETELPAAGPAIKANANQLQQVLTNLATNGWEACPATGGTVRLSVTTVAASAISTLHRFPLDGRLQDTPYACLEVTDTGCGIAEHDIGKIFDPFYSSKFPGRGMGLAVVLGIIRSCGGIITVESAADRGSSFRVYLPVAAG
ncbi:MAG: PAS domain S-box protein [Lacunisphaera sp.]|nr:PAS domain S-box protein [Lacunisphaera sp.]